MATTPNTAAWPTTTRYLVLDTETTGVDANTDRIVTACAAIMESGEPVFTRTWLIAVDIDIPEAATAVHGITTEHAREHGVPAADAIPEIANAVRYAVHSGMPIVAFVAAFDLSILNAECARHGLDSLAGFCGRDIAPVIDPYVLDKATDKYRPGERKLTATCKHFDVVLDDAHDATADAVAAGRVAARMAERSRLDAEALRALYPDRKYPDRLIKDWQTLGRMTLDQLHASQVRWYAEQTKSFGQYLQRETNALRHTADHTEDDAERATALADAELLDARIAALSGDWPLIPLNVAEEAMR